MTFVDLVALTLAASGLLAAWFRGSLFAGARVIMELKDEAFHLAPPEPAQAASDESPSEAPLPWTLWVVDKLMPDFVGTLLSCALCLSYHAPFWLGLAFWVPSLWLSEPWSVLVKFPLYALAATRAGNILTGLLPAALQYQPDLHDDTDSHEYDDA